MLRRVIILLLSAFAYISLDDVQAGWQLHGNTTAAPLCPWGAALPDGCPGAPLASSVTIQHTNFFSGYATQSGQTYANTGHCTNANCHPPWNVAGVDYPVGVNASYAPECVTACSTHKLSNPGGASDPTISANIQAWSAGNAAGCSYSSSTRNVYCSGTYAGAVTIDGMDFSYHGNSGGFGIGLNLGSGLTGSVTISNSRLIFDSGGLTPSPSPSESAAYSGLGTSLINDIIDVHDMDNSVASPTFSGSGPLISGTNVAFGANQPVEFRDFGGTLPTQLKVDTKYIVCATNLSTTGLQVATSLTNCANSVFVGASGFSSSTGTITIVGAGWGRRYQLQYMFGLYANATVEYSAIMDCPSRCAGVNGINDIYSYWEGVQTYNTNTFVQHGDGIDVSFNNASCPSCSANSWIHKFSTWLEPATASAGAQNITGLLTHVINVPDTAGNVAFVNGSPIVTISSGTNWLAGHMINSDNASTNWLTGAVPPYSIPQLAPYGTGGTSGTGASGTYYMYQEGTTTAQNWVQPTAGPASGGTDPYTTVATTDIENMVLVTNGTAARSASGWIAFLANPSNGDTITLNGTTWTFVTSGATGTQINIGASIAATVDAAVAALTASGDTNTAQFVYYAGQNFNTGTYHTNLNLTAAAAGTGGNSLTVAASVATVTAMSGGLYALESNIVGRLTSYDYATYTNMTFKNNFADPDYTTGWSGPGTGSIYNQPTGACSYQGGGNVDMTTGNNVDLFSSGNTTPC